MSKLPKANKLFLQPTSHALVSIIPGLAEAYPHLSYIGAPKLKKVMMRQKGQVIEHNYGPALTNFAGVYQHRIPFAQPLNVLLRAVEKNERLIKTDDYDLYAGIVDTSDLTSEKKLALNLNSKQNVIKNDFKVNEYILNKSAIKTGRTDLGLLSQIKNISTVSQRFRPILLITKPLFSQMQPINPSQNIPEVKFQYKKGLLRVSSRKLFPTYSEDPETFVVNLILLVLTIGAILSLDWSRNGREWRRTQISNAMYNAYGVPSDGDSNVLSLEDLPPALTLAERWEIGKYNYREENEIITRQ